jgi:nicotinamidase-related amidase
MSDTALLVIDAQESFRKRGPWNEADYQAYVAKQQQLIDGAKARGMPIVSIFHVDPTGDFSMESGNVRTLNELTVTPDFTVHKNMHSALAGTPLQAWLVGKGIRHLIISGIRSEQCCETTTRHASDSGFSVDYVTEATHTFAMTHANGTVYTAQQIKERCELVLSNRFARIVTVDQALASKRAA